MAIIRIDGIDPRSDFDYVDNNGDIIQGAQPREVMIRTAADLDELVNYIPGSIAANADYSKMWRLAANGTWTQFVGEEA